MMRSLPRISRGKGEKMALYRISNRLMVLEEKKAEDSQL
jgi:hypothetical protein